MGAFVRVETRDVHTTSGRARLIKVGSGGEVLEPRDVIAALDRDLFAQGQVDGVIFSGALPMWAVCMFVDAAANSAVGTWVAYDDPKTAGAVVVVDGSTASRGDVVIFTPPGSGARPAVAFVGPPHAGKSTLLAILDRMLKHRLEGQYQIFRANPDGEGTWAADIPLESMKALRRKRAHTRDFTQYAVDSIATLRQRHRMTLVDCGGRIAANTRRLLSVCTHAVLLGQEEADPADLDAWRQTAFDHECDVIADIITYAKAASPLMPDDSGTLRGRLPALRDVARDDLRARLGPLADALMNLAGPTVPWQNTKDACRE